MYSINYGRIKVKDAFQNVASIRCILCRMEDAYEKSDGIDFKIWEMCQVNLTFRVKVY